MRDVRQWKLAFGAMAVLIAGNSCSGSNGTGDAGPHLDSGVDLGVIDVVSDTGVDVVTVMDAGFHCQSNADCNGNASGAVCNTATGACGQCVASADTCPSSQHCDATSSQCVAGCRSDDGCTSADAGVSDGGDGGLSAAFCNTTTNTCVQCLMDEQCAPGTVCTANACVPGCAADQACPTGQTCCGTGCVDLQTNATNCGTCSTNCMAANDSPACVAGVCTVGTCASGFADCNMTVADGCEVNIATSVANCGACGSVCAPANATPTCAAGVCAIASCMGVFADCDTMVSNGCEVNTATSLANCGSCGHTCAVVANSVPTCLTGACGYTCNAGFADCDVSATNGCEINTQTDANNCGTCGHACALGEGCTAGVCQFGSGSSGPLNVTGSTTLSTVASPAAGVAGATSVTVTTVTGFAVGQEVLLHQSQSSTGAVGQYEFVRVTAVAGSTLTLAAPLVSTYLNDATDRAQAIVVPQYTTVTVAAGGTLSAPAWNGATGGILVFDAAGAVSISGTVSMDGLGFRGHQRVCATPLTHCAVGISGESSLGLGQSTTVANGSGGGGGGAGQDCGAGGGGGYSVGGDQGTSGTPPGVCGVAGTDGLIPPGDGGSAVGTPSLAGSFLFGAAGGEGGLDEDGALPGPGGNGGGVVLVRSASITVSATGTISVHGATGGTGSSSAVTCAGAAGSGMGGGGGGAGGAVRLVAATSANVGAARVTSLGGDGGECSTPGNNYPGGTGSSGRVGILSPSAVVGTTSPVFDPS